MKKSIALVLTVILLVATAAAGFAAHTHTYAVSTSLRYLDDNGQVWVVAGSCPHLPYSGHYHFCDRYLLTKTYTCRTCGHRYTSTSTVNRAPYRCPMAK